MYIYIYVYIYICHCLLSGRRDPETEVESPRQLGPNDLGLETNHTTLIMIIIIILIIIQHIIIVVVVLLLLLLPHRAKVSQFELFELFELVLVLNLDNQFPVEQFEGRLS